MTFSPLWNTLGSELYFDEESRSLYSNSRLETIDTRLQNVSNNKSNHTWRPWYLNGGSCAPDSDPPAIAGSLPATTRLQVQARVVGSARPLGGGTVRDESELANHGRGLVGSCRPVFGRPAAATRKKRERQSWLRCRRPMEATRRGPKASAARWVLRRVASR